MKFTLVENINEGILTEKMWVELRDGELPPIYFYATNKEQVEKTLAPIINNTHKGTFKQQLNPELLKLIREKYKGKIKDDGSDFPFTVQNVMDGTIKFTKDNCLSLTDRQLRRESNKLGSSYIDNKKVLVHHKNGLESDNDKENLLIIDRSNDTVGCEEVASAAHSLLHNNKIGTQGSYGETYIYEYDNNKDKFIKKYKVFLVLKEV